jgi:hypothetical protein
MRTIKTGILPLLLFAALIPTLFFAVAGLLDGAPVIVQVAALAAMAWSLSRWFFRRLDAYEKWERFQAGRAQGQRDALEGRGGMLQ